MEYTVDFTFAEAIIRICIEADSEKEAEEKAKEIISNEPERVARGFSTNVANWDCSVWFYADYVRIRTNIQNLGASVVKFEHGKVITFFDFYHGDPCGSRHFAARVPEGRTNF